MKIFDCFTYFDESELLEIRLNELNKFVDYFVIIESGETHQGGKKTKNINNNLLKKFGKKIRYYYIKKFKKNQSSWTNENYQRNCISKGLYDAKNEDIIIISDIDEIPNLKNINFKKIKNTIFAFRQLHSMYKFNLLRKDKWLGTKLCSFNKLISPQWLRSLKVHKKYSKIRIDKIFSKSYVSNFKIIENGGWHFGWLKKSKLIKKKLESYAHSEHNTKELKNIKSIDFCIKNKINFFDYNEKLFIKKNIFYLPEYIRKNKKKFKKFIL